MTRALRSQLGELDVERVTLASEGSAPRGAKAGEAFTVGALALVVLPTLLPKLVGFLQAWLTRSERKASMRIRLEDDGKVVDIELDGTNRSVEEILTLARRVTEKRKRAPAKPAS